MMFEDGEPSSSSTIYKEQQQEETNVRVDNAKRHQSPSSKKLSPYHEDVLLELNESIQSMMSFSVSELVEEEESIKDHASNNNNDKSQKSDTMNSRSLQESIQSILSDSYSQLDHQQKQEAVALEQQRVAPCNTKSCSTLTTAGSTAANSKSSVSYDSHDLEGFLRDQSDCSGYYGSCDGRVNRVDREPMRGTNSTSCFKTPSSSRPRLRGSTTMNSATTSAKSKSSQFSVPQNIFSPRGVLVSPLSIDPSPGHDKMQVHQEMLRHLKVSGPTSNRSNSASSSSSRGSAELSVSSQPQRKLSHVSEANDRDAQSPSFTKKDNKSPMDSFGSLNFDHELLNGFGSGDDDDDNEDESIGQTFQIVAGRNHGSSQSIGNVSVASAISNSGRYLNDSCGEVTMEPRRSTPRKNRSTGSLAKAKAVNPRANVRIVPKKNKSAGSLAAVIRNNKSIANASPFTLETPRPPTPMKRRQKMRSKKNQQNVRKDIMMMISSTTTSPKKSPRQEHNKVSSSSLKPPLQDDRESIGTMALNDHRGDHRGGRSKSPHLYVSPRRSSARSRTPDKQQIDISSRDRRRSKTPDKLLLQEQQQHHDSRRRSKSRTGFDKSPRKNRSRSRGRLRRDDSPGAGAAACCPPTNLSASSRCVTNVQYCCRWYYHLYCILLDYLLYLYYIVGLTC